MTTLVALPTKDAVVMGCDSLGTVSRPMVDPRDLFGFFDSGGALKVDGGGAPKLKSLSQIVDLAASFPFDHMTDVDKIIELSPLKLGVMFTGIASIGDRTVKSLLSDFISKDKAFKPDATNYTVKSIAKRLLESMQSHYQSEFSTLQAPFRPNLELVLAGYSKTGPHPAIAKINLKRNEVEMQDPFWPVFAGQSREIERIVYGLDFQSFVRIEERHAELMKALAEQTARMNGGTKVPDLTKQQRVFTQDFRVPGITANWGDFSEQNAIDCVGYFVRIMEGAQRFSARMPTVGGAIHVALVDRQKGFRFISRREYSHEDHRVQRD